MCSRRGPGLGSAALLAGALLAAGCGGETGSERVATAAVARGDLEVVITAQGPVQPPRVVEVKSRASGEVRRIPFDAGVSVTRATTIVVIDPRDEEEAVELAQADLVTARANLTKAKAAHRIESEKLEPERDRARSTLEKSRAEAEKARRDFERQSDLFGKGLASKQELDVEKVRLETLEAAVRANQAELEILRVRERQVEVSAGDVELGEAGVIRAEVALRRARERLADTTIESPIDAVILERKVEVGQIIASGISNVGGGTALLVLADVSKLHVKAMVDEADIGALAVDQPAQVLSDAFPDRRFEGKVTWIAPLAKTENDVTSFEVLVEIAGEGSRALKPGMNATCQFVVASAKDVLWVPPVALKSEQGHEYVNAVADDAPGTPHVPTPVEVGLRNQDRVEVRGEGIREGLLVLATEPKGKAQGDDPLWFIKKRDPKKPKAP